MQNGNVSSSALKRDMIALPTPCKDTIYYPINLSILGTQGKHSVFMAMSHKNGKAYIVTTQPDRVRFRLGGPPEQIAGIYHNIPWPEVEMRNRSVKFLYKEAPSFQELEEYFKKFSK